MAFVGTPLLLRPKSLGRCGGAVSIRRQPGPGSRVMVPRAAAAAAVTEPLKPRAIPAAVPLATGLRDRLLFYLGEFFLWEPAAKVVALFLVCLVCIGLGSLLFRLADPRRSEAKSPFWHSVRAVANPLEDDWDSVPLRTVSIVLAAFGMIFFGILVGMITDAVQASVQNANTGNTTIVAKGHTVFLGWGSRCAQTLRDFAEVSDGERVVVLAAGEERDALVGELREVLGSDKRKRLKLHYREGVPVLSSDLRRVSAEQAAKIVLVHPRAHDLLDGDRKVISRALALKQSIPDFKGEIVAELNNKRDERIIKRIFEQTQASSIQTINAEELLFRFLAQAIRSPGLADIVDTMMGSKKSTIFHVRRVNQVAPQLKGVRYGDLRPTSIPGCLVVGYFKEDGNVSLTSPGQDDGPVLWENTELLLLGMPGADKERAPEIEVPVAMMENALRKDSGKPERYLVCGWRPDMRSMLSELDKILPKRSTLTILDDDIDEKQTNAFIGKLKNLKVRCITKRPDVYENLRQVILGNTYDNIVLLGSALGIEDQVSASGTNEDSKALATYVYVNELLEEQREKDGDDTHNTLVTIEFNNPDVATIAKTEDNVSNAVLPQNLSAKIAAQTMRESRLNGVWRELLGQSGKEVYVVPMSRYLADKLRTCSFRSMADAAARDHNHSCIGFVAKGREPLINPVGKDRYESRAWQDGDLMIVLAEEADGK